MPRWRARADGRARAEAVRAAATTRASAGAVAIDGDTVARSAAFVDESDGQVSRRDRLRLGGRLPHRPTGRDAAPLISSGGQRQRPPTQRFGQDWPAVVRGDRRQDTFVIGAYNDDDSGRGSAYVFRTTDALLCGARFASKAYSVEVAKLARGLRRRRPGLLRLDRWRSTAYSRNRSPLREGSRRYIFRTTDGGDTYNQVVAR